jgi:hypothetical protein
MDRIEGYKKLPKLREALQRELDLSDKTPREEAVKEPFPE